MIFVTVGTTKFEELIKKVDEIVPQLDTEVIMQIGKGRYIPKNSEYFRFSHSLKDYLKNADIIISHGGAGTLFEILEENKKIIAVENPEVPDSHQWDLLLTLSQKKHIIWCKNLEELPKYLKDIKKYKFKKYKKPKCDIDIHIRKFLQDKTKSKDIKVLMIGTKGKGGMSYVVNNFLNSSVLKKYNIKFIATHNERKKPQIIFYFLSGLIVSLKYLYKKEYKIIHLHVSKQGSLIRKVVFIILAKIFKKKIILHTHSGRFMELYNNYNRFTQKIIKSFFNKADAIIVLSKKRKKEYSKIILQKEKIHILPNYVKIPKNIKRKHKSEKIKIISLGVLNKNKGTDDLLVAFKNLKINNVILELGGNGDLNYYQQVIKKFNLRKKVKLLGWVNGKKKISLFETADIFVLPSYYEDLPISILEAMSYGLPIISTNVGGIPELVKQGFNGYLIKPGDINNLRVKLKILITNEKLRVKMGNNSLSIIKQKYSPKKIESQISKLYENLKKEI